MTTRVYNNQQLKLLRQIVEPLQSTRDVMVRRVDKVYRDLMIGHFSSEGSGISGPWAPLTPRYEAWKKKRFPGRKILQRTGAMRAAFVNKGSGHRAMCVVSENRWWFILGGNSEYARYHQKGTPKMKRRPLHDFTPEQNDMMAEALKREMIRQVKHLWKQILAWRHP